MKYNYISLPFIAIALSGCAVSEAAIDETESHIQSSPTLVVQNDSMSLRKINSIIQSSHENILVNSIVQDGNKRTLSISPEEAKELGIPDIKYREFVLLLQWANE